eukprot:jgi/Astpho2/7771/Aster-x0783
MWKREKEFRQELAKAAQKSSKGAISKLETIAVEDALQCYKHVCALIERELKKASPAQCVHLLYVISAICRASAKKHGGKDKYGARVEPMLPVLAQRLALAPDDKKAGIAKVLRGWQKQSLFSGNALSEMQRVVGVSLKHSSSLGTAEAAPNDVRGSAGKAEAVPHVAALADAAEELSEPSAGSIEGFVVPEAVLDIAYSALGPPDRTAESAAGSVHSNRPAAPEPYDPFAAESLSASPLSTMPLPGPKVVLPLPPVGDQTRLSMSGGRAGQAGRLPPAPDSGKRKASEDGSWLAASQSQAEEAPQAGRRRRANKWGAPAPVPLAEDSPLPAALPGPPLDAKSAPDTSERPYQPQPGVPAGAGGPAAGVDSAAARSAAEAVVQRLALGAGAAPSAAAPSVAEPSAAEPPAPGRKRRNRWAEADAGEALPGPPPVCADPAALVAASAAAAAVVQRLAQGSGAGSASTLAAAAGNLPEVPAPAARFALTMEQPAQSAEEQAAAGLAAVEAMLAAKRGGRPAPSLQEADEELPPLPQELGPADVAGAAHRLPWGPPRPPHQPPALFAMPPRPPPRPPAVPYPDVAEVEMEF